MKSAACAALAAITFTGCAHAPAGTSQDGARGRLLLEKACEQGHGSACTSLGVLFQEGRVVGPDPIRAGALFRRACELGEGEGCARLLNTPTAAAAAEATAAPPGAPPPESPAAARLLIEAGQDSLARGRFAEAWVHLRSLVGAAVFGQLDPEERHRALSAAGFAALQCGRRSEAMDTYRQAVGLPGATLYDWYLLYASTREGEPMEAARALVAMARGWPAALLTVHEEAVYGTALAVRRLAPAQLLELLQALFEAGYKASNGAEPSLFWQELVLAWFERGDRGRAAEVARRLDRPSKLISFLVDRRFDDLVAADPGAFDVAASRARHLEQRRTAVERAPRSLDILNSLLSYLLAARRFEEGLTLVDEALHRARAGTAAYDDLGELPWSRLVRAELLQALGRWDEAVEELRRASVEAPGNRAAQDLALNLAGLCVRLERPQEALEVIGRLEGPSPSGRRQAEQVRTRVALQLPDPTEAERALRHLRDNAAAAPHALLTALLQRGEDGEAAALVSSLLADPAQRGAMLLRLQRFPGFPQTRLDTELNRRLEALLARPDVRAAVEKVGRIGTWEVAPLGGSW